MIRAFPLVAAAFLSASAVRAAPAEVEPRRAAPDELSVDVERIELPNGLVVLLAPERVPTTSSVLVWMTYRAGTIYEPPGRSGLAHLVEHLLATGPTPETDYAWMLERRRARWFNAFTSFDSMTFGVMLPAEELPFALWVEADRLGTLPALLDQGRVERERRVIAQERALRQVDEPFGLVDEHLFSRLFADPHPLHGGVLGAPANLESVGLEDVRSFVGTLLVPANATLTIVGNFDPAVARRLVEQGLGRLAPGRRAAAPKLFPLASGLVDERVEPISRQPRVTMAWRFPNIPDDHAAALGLGAQLLTFLTDGAWGMRISARFNQYVGEGLFRMDLVLPYDESKRALQDDAEGFLRMLTGREMPSDLVLAANLAMDRGAMFGLDTLGGRAALLTHLEQLYGPRESVGNFLRRHWSLDRELVRDVSRGYLRLPRVVVHARPTRPRPARITRDDLEEDVD